MTQAQRHALAASGRKGLLIPSDRLARRRLTGIDRGPSAPLRTLGVHLNVLGIHFVTAAAHQERSCCDKNSKTRSLQAAT